MADMLPMLGAAGIYTLKAPFNTDLLANTQYTCVAIRKLVEIVAGGGDPFTDYYVPKSLDKSTYTTDLTNDVSIVTLQAADNSLVPVPSSYLAAYPDGGGIPYRVIIVSGNLGAIPDSLDLSPIQQKIQDDIAAILGIQDVTIRVSAVSNVKLLDTATAQGLESARQANITNNTTDYSMLVQVTAQRDQALQRITELENYILSNNGLPPVENPDGSSPNTTA